MFVGDSMTIGRAGDFTWRYRMWQHLSSTFGGPYRIVGPRSELYEGSDAYADPAFPADARRHLAGWGEGWQHMAPSSVPPPAPPGPTSCSSRSA